MRVPGKQMTTVLPKKRGKNCERTKRIKKIRSVDAGDDVARFSKISHTCISTSLKVRRISAIKKRPMQGAFFIRAVKRVLFCLRYHFLYLRYHSLHHAFN